jgi:hypothetical protein
MRKVLLAAIIGLTVGCSNAQQNNKNVEVPEAVKSAFSAKYPNATKLTWEDEGGTFEAGFVQNKTEFSAVFDTQGKFMEEETEIKVSALPKAIVDYCKTNYADQKMSEAAKITMNSGEIKFEAELSKGKMHFDAIFDANGNFISKGTPVSEDEEDKD